MVRVSAILALSCIVLAKQANAAACQNDYSATNVQSATGGTVSGQAATTNAECEVGGTVAGLIATQTCNYVCKTGFGDDNVSKKFEGAGGTACTYLDGDGSTATIESATGICIQEMCTFKGAYTVTYKDTKTPSDYPTGDCDWGGAGCPKNNIDANVDTVSCRDSTNFTQKDGDLSASFTCSTAGGSFTYGGTSGCDEHTCNKIADQAGWDSLSGLPAGSKCMASTKTTAMGVTDSSVTKVGQMKQYSGDDGLYEACVVECKAPASSGTKVDFTWKSGGLPMCVLPEGVPHGTADCKHGSSKGCTITDLQKTGKNSNCDTDTFNNNNDKTDWSNASCTAGTNGEPGVFTTTTPKMAFQICYSTKHPVTASPVTASPITSSPITSSPATLAPTGFSAASTVAASFVAAASTALLMML